MHRRVIVMVQIGYTGLQATEALFSYDGYINKHMSRLSYEPRCEKTGFCICENKDADQLRGNREADQRLCFRYTDGTIPLLPKSEISS